MRALVATTAGVLTLALLSPSGTSTSAEAPSGRPNATQDSVRTVAAAESVEPAEAEQAQADPAETVAARLVVAGGAAAVDPDVTRMLAACDADLDVVAGEDRFATAALLSANVTSSVAVVTNGRNFPDALAAATFVGTDMALLLTEQNALPDATIAAIRDGGIDEVIVLGGPAAVSDDVLDQLANLVGRVRRIDGENRWETAARLAREFADGRQGIVHVANGRRFADALALGPLAIHNDGPVLLVDDHSVPASTADALRDLAKGEIIVAGGPNAVSDEVLADIERLADGVPVRRVAGATRYATAAALAAELPDGPGAVVVSGLGFPDALAAGPAAARMGAPLLLVGADIERSVADELDGRRPWDCRPVTVRPSVTEGLTLGPRALFGPVVLEARAGDVAVPITDASAGATLLLDGAATVTMTYPEPAGGVPAVTWDELLDPTQTSIEVEQPWRNQLSSPAQDLTVAWQYTGDSARYRQEVAAAPGLNVTAPFRYFLRTDGTVGDSVDATFIADMHARGVEVWPTIHAAGADGIAAALTDQDRRRTHALAISRSAEAAGADGINIDIEGFPVSLRDAVTDFTQVLSQDVHRWGGVTSYDLTSMTDTWITPPVGYEFWSTAPDRRAIADAVDYSVLMAYDQFNRFRPRGPVADDAWVEEALRYQLRFSDPDRVLLGLPLYARIWRGDNPSAVGQSALKSFIASGSSAPDPRFAVDRVVGADGRVTWAETSDRLTSRLDMVDRYGLAGTASWRLGFDDPATWASVGDGGPRR